ncbi:MAG: Ig-like domain-containing protein [Pseudomonadota bacterium]
MLDFSLVGFSNETVIGSGLAAPIALGFLPDGRMLVLEKGGEVSIADPETGNKSLYLDISGIVNSQNERGLLEIAIPPDFDPTGATGDNHIYLFYTRSAGTDRGVIGRFEHVEGAGGLSSTADINSEEILWTDTDDLSSCCHHGGGLDFGPDGKLWLTTSDKFNTSNTGERGDGDDVNVNVSLNLESTSGKIIRINRDGTIPDGTDGWPANPYVDQVVDGPYPDANSAPFGSEFVPDASIWAYGLRNAFRADWDLVNEKLYIGEVGGNQGLSRDDIHVASLDQAGAFYGWNFYEGVNNVQPQNSVANFIPADFPQPDQDLADPANGDFYSAPIYDIAHSSLTGGFVYRGDQFPEEFQGVYFFGNYESNYIQFLDLDSTGSFLETTGTEENGAYAFKPSAEIPEDVSNVVFLEQGTDGALYYINYSGSGGQVQRIVYGGGVAPVISNTALSDDQGDPDDGAGPNSPLTVLFTATVTDADTALSDLTYTLNFGDGTSPVIGTPDTATGEISVTHIYAGEANYTASLSVSDGTRTTFATPFSITVGDPNDPPQILSAEPDVAFGDPPLTVTFTAVVTDPDADDPPESLIFTWDFGDGSPFVTGSPDTNGNISVQHTYTTDGLFSASLAISDGEAPDVSSGTIPIATGDASSLPVTDQLVFQVEAFIKVGVNGSTVTEWLDESGNGNNLLAFGDPQYVQDATPTGQPAIVLDGNGDFLQRVDATDPVDGFSTGNAPRTMFFVVDYEEVTNNESAGLVYGKTKGNGAFGLTLDGDENDFTVHAWGGANDRPTDIDGVIEPTTGEQRGFVSHAVVFDGTTYTHYVNGQVIDSGARTYATVLERLVIGQNLNGGETPMSVAAAYIYSKALDANEFQAVENYIQSTFLAGPVSDQPDAIDDTYTATADQLLTVPVSTGLLDNDVDDDILTVTEINGQAVNDGDTVALTNGQLSIGADGSFTYGPAIGFFGAETFTYTASDGALTDTANVTITVEEPVSDQPDAIDDTYTATADQLLTVPVSTGLLDNDVDDDILTVTEINGQAVNDGDTVALTNGQLTIGTDGSFTYAPAIGFSGVEAFTYTASDGALTDTANVAITINDTSGNNPPAAGNLVGAFETDFGITEDNGSVSGWLSSAGTNLDLTASGNPQLLQNATPTGRAAISLDGTDDWLDRDLSQDTGTSVPIGDASRTLYFVVDYKTTQNYAGVSYGTGKKNEAFGLVVDGNGGNLTVQGWGGGNDIVSSQEGVDGTQTGVGEWLIHSVRYDGTTVRHYLNDQLISETVRGDYNTTASRFVIGEEINGKGNGEPMDVAAVLLYDKALDDAEHAQAIQYLTDKYLTDQSPNTPATIAGETTGTVVEDGAGSATAILSVTDPDPGEDVFDTTPVSGPSYGSFTITSAGTWTYTLDNANAAVDNLDDDEQLIDQITVQSADGTASQTIDITINGNTDSVVVPGDNPVTSGLIAAFETEGINSNGTNVTGWSDSSGAGNDYSLTGVNGDPSLTTSPTGQSAIYLDGNGDYLRDVGTAEVQGLPEADAARTLYFVVDYKTEGKFTGFAYGDDNTNQTFGLVAETDESLSIEGWASGTRDSGVEGVLTLGWMVQSVVMDGPNYWHYINTIDGGLQLIDSGTDGTFNTNVNDATSALAIGAKVAASGARSNTSGEMDVAAALIYDAALSTGANDLGGDHASVSQYLAEKYLGAPAGNLPPVADDDTGITDEDFALIIDVLNGDSDPDGTIAGITAIDGQSAIVDTPVALASGGTAALLATNQISYDPNGAFESLNDGDTATDSFTYTIIDDGGGEATATVFLTINGVTDDTVIL